MSAHRGIGRRRLSGAWMRLLLFALLAPLHASIHSAYAMAPLDMDEELRLLRDGKARIHIGGARYRFAVFTFEDPDGTGLGNAVATIISHDLLMNGKVSSLGVLRYLGGLGKAGDERQLRYFDKVEPLIESQDVQVAVWGMIRRTQDGVRIDSYTQLSPSAVHTAFSFTFRLPREMGRAPLIHRVAPDRLLTQQLELSTAEAGALAGIADNIDQLRQSPSDSAPIAGRLPVGKVHYLRTRQGDWAELVIEGGGPVQSGWLRASGFCSGPCAPLLEVSQFATGLMAYDAGERIPSRSSALEADAQALIDQLRAVDALNHARPEEAEEAALRILQPWCPAEFSGKDLSIAPPPGGAATCNLRALAQLVGPSRQAARERPPRTLERARVQAVTEVLAQVSLYDPRNVPTLRNLATLFSLLGDSERAGLAGRLADQAVAAERNR